MAGEYFVLPVNILRILLIFNGFFAMRLDWGRKLLMKGIRMTKFYYHIHHNCLVEPLLEPIKIRIKYIKETKPKSEQKLRLRLLRPVKGELPVLFVQAGRAYERAKQVYEQARQKAYGQGWPADGQTEKD